MRFDKVLVVANETIAGANLHQQILDMTEPGGEVMVIAPALSSRLKYIFSDVDEPREQAQARLDESLELMKRSGINATGAVGDANPTLAVHDALAVFKAGAIIVSTHPEGRSNWIEHNVVEKIRDHNELPVTHVVVDMTAHLAAESVEPSVAQS